MIVRRKRHARLPGRVATTRPDQVQCIFLRNTSATDSEDKFPYNTGGFQGIPQNKYMFFKVPDDLTNLDIAGGQCWNQTIMQNVTFGYQDEELGIHGSGAGRVGANGGSLMALIVSMFISFWMLA